MTTADVALFSQTFSDPKMIEAMNTAYRQACRELHDKGQPKLVQDVIAGRIVEIARSGERDPRRICERVLRELGLQR